MFICFNLNLHFLVAGLLEDELLISLKSCSAAAANVAFCRGCDCRCSPVPCGCVASHACTSVWLGTGFCHGWVEGKRAAVFCCCG